MKRIEPYIDYPDRKDNPVEAEDRSNRQSGEVNKLLDFIVGFLKWTALGAGICVLLVVYGEPPLTAPLPHTNLP